jgi:hypothetical protein
MSFNIGNNIGSVEGGNTTGQSYSTKIVRTYELSVTLTANAVSTNGCILAADGTDVGYKTIPITTPFMNGTKPKHLTIQNVRISSNSASVKTSGMGILIFPTLPTGVFNRSNCQTGTNTSTMSIAYSYISSGLGAFSSDAYSTLLFTLNQMIGTSTNINIDNLYIILYLGTTGFTPVAGTIVNLQVDVSFE